MTGTHQIYAKQRFYGNPRVNSVSKHHEAKTVQKDPELGKRLDKILKENLNTSTEKFILSLKEWYDKAGGLTPRQLDSFQQVESRYSPAEKAKLKEWTVDYRENHLSEAKVLASYYLNAGYWVEMAAQILNAEDYIPPRHKYFKMSTNKYALRVLENYRNAPKFEKGAMVQLRATVGKHSSYRYLGEFRNRLCFVLDHSSNTLSATKGGKGYTVLPMGHHEPIRLEERHLMKPNKKGKSV